MAGSGKYRFLAPATVFVFFAGVLAFFGFLYPYHLLFTEQLQVFLLTAGHFVSYLSKPAFLASYTGDFLTQFYFLKWGGAFVITLTLLCFWLLIRLFYRKVTGGKYSVFITLLPVALGWISLCYPEYPLSNIISVIISVAVTLIVVSQKSPFARFLSGLFLTPVLYILAGSSFYILPLTIIFLPSSRPLRIWLFSEAAILIFVAIAFPLAMRGSYLLTKGEALLCFSQMTGIRGIITYLPVAGVVVALMAGVLSAAMKRFPTDSIPMTLIQPVALLCLVIIGLQLTSDFTMEKILRLDNEALKERWDNVDRLAGRYDIHNELAAYYGNMALAKLGRLPQDLMLHYQPIATGLFIPVNANENYLTITFSNEIYWQLGDINAAQHSALLGTIFSPRAANSRLLKRLTEINIVNGQYAPAEKFIGILKKTMFHRKWAEGMRKYLFNETECSKARWITDKRALIPSADKLKKGNEYVITLRMLAESNPGNTMAVDYLLCYHLLCKDIHSFLNDFDRYYRSRGTPLIPEVYQEGLLIGIVSGARRHEDYSNFAFTPATVGRMAEYTKLFSENKGNGAPLQKDFGKAYWFYFHFAKMKVE